MEAETVHDFYGGSTLREGPVLMLDTSTSRSLVGNTDLIGAPFRAPDRPVVRRILYYRIGESREGLKNFVAARREAATAGFGG